MNDYCLTSFSRWQVKQTVYAAGLGRARLFEDLSHFWLLVVQQLGSSFLGGGCWRGRTRSQDVGGWLWWWCGGGGEDVKPASLELPAD